MVMLCFGERAEKIKKRAEIEWSHSSGGADEAPVDPGFPAYQNPRVVDVVAWAYQAGCVELALLSLIIGRKFADLLRVSARCGAGSVCCREQHWLYLHAVGYQRAFL